MKTKEKDPEKVWAEFGKEVAGVTPEQLVQFQKYATYLLECNELFNLTAITQLSGVVRRHFQDSLALDQFVDMKTIKTIADIGTGAGFPALPLKIMYPHLKVVLIEVTKKKQEFLADVIRLLGLEDVEVCGLDWRTFLRNTDYPIDIFVTRAALDDLELSRMFRPACVYRNVPLAYWASKEWEPHAKVKDLITRSEDYKAGRQGRRLIFMTAPKEPIAQ